MRDLRSYFIRFIVVISALNILLASLVHGEGLRMKKPSLDIDFGAVQKCFLGYLISPEDPSPDSWCKLNLSFGVFLRCMDKNISLRMVDSGLMDMYQKEDTMYCLSQSYIDTDIDQKHHHNKPSLRRGS